MCVITNNMSAAVIPQVPAGNAENSTSPMMQKLHNVRNHVRSYFVAGVNASNASNGSTPRCYASQRFLVALRSVKNFFVNIGHRVAEKLGHEKLLYEGAPSRAERRAQGVAHATLAYPTPESRQAASLETVIAAVMIPIRDACYKTGDKAAARIMDDRIVEKLWECDRLLLPDAGASRTAPPYPGAPSEEQIGERSQPRAPLALFSEAAREVARLDKHIDALMLERHTANKARMQDIDGLVEPLHFRRDVLASDM